MMMRFDSALPERGFTNDSITTFRFGLVRADRDRPVESGSREAPPFFLIE
jgi:hypothetical protein